MSPKVWESAPPPTHIWERSPKKSVFLCLPLPRNILSTQGKSNDRAPTSLRVWALLSGQLDMGRKGWGARPRELGRWHNWYKTQYKWPLTNLLWLPLHIQFSPLNVHPPPHTPKAKLKPPLLFSCLSPITSLFDICCPRPTFPSKPNFYPNSPISLVVGTF